MVLTSLETANRMNPSQGRSRSNWQRLQRMPAEQLPAKSISPCKNASICWQIRYLHSIFCTFSVCSLLKIKKIKLANEINSIHFLVPRMLTFLNECLIVFNQPWNIVDLPHLNEIIRCYSWFRCVWVEASAVFNGGFCLKKWICCSTNAHLRETNEKKQIYRIERPFLVRMTWINAHCTIVFLNRSK